MKYMVAANILSKFSLQIYFTVTAILTAVVILSALKFLLPEDKLDNLRGKLVVIFFGIFLILLSAGLFIFWTYGEYTALCSVLHGLSIGLLMAIIPLGPFRRNLFSGAGLFFISLSAVEVLAVLFGLVAVNYLAVQYPKKWDFTQQKLASLNDETIKAINSIKEPVEIVGFFYKNQKDIIFQVTEFFQPFIEQNRAKLKLKIINPATNPDLVACYGVKDFGGGTPDNPDQRIRNRVLLATGKCKHSGDKVEFVGRKVELERLSEEEFTNKLLKLLSGKKKEICFAEGHAQPSLERGLSALKELLTVKGLETRQINILTDAKSLDNCDVLVQVTPELVSLLKRDPNSGRIVINKYIARFEKIEIERIRDYLKKGGKLLYFAEPLVETGLEPLLEKEFGIKVQKGVVVSFLPNAGEPMTPIAQNFDPNHEITKGFKNKFQMIMHWATALKKADNPPSDVVLTELVKTIQIPVMVGTSVSKKLCCTFFVPNPFSRGFAQLMNMSQTWRRGAMLQTVARGIVKQLVPDAVSGPFTVAMAASKKSSNPQQETRVVVFGDGAVATNRLIGYNDTIVYNTLAWLAQEKHRIHIPPKRRADRRVTFSTVETNFIKYTLRYGIPLFFFMIFIIVFLIRLQK